MPNLDTLHVFACFHFLTCFHNLPNRFSFSTPSAYSYKGRETNAEADIEPLSLEIY